MDNAAIDIGAATRSFLLRMGNTWFAQKELRQATDVYLRLVNEYPESAESQAAKIALMNISSEYENNGLLRASLDILERLEQTIISA